MLSKIYYTIIVALCVLLVTATALAQPTQDSTNLTKMTEGGHKAVDNAVPLTVLTQDSLYKTFKGMEATVDNVADYQSYAHDLVYKILGNDSTRILRVERYTPSRECPSGLTRNMCRQRNQQYVGRFVAMCSIPKGTTSCTTTDGSYYELTLSGLLMGESYWGCASGSSPVVGHAMQCGYKQYPRRTYLWDKPRASQ